ncbi:MAG: DUF4301 family protein [Deltaproteobacteria bacterium]|nr:DUF4301 family protein [Deltaproteobacteria bacterium]
MPEKPFAQSDLERIRNEGLTVEDLSSQLELLRGETIPLTLAGACSIGDGIVALPDSGREALLPEHERAAAEGRTTKFVPASGAASRMFQQWFAWCGTEGFNTTEDAATLAGRIPRFAFYDDLSRAIARGGGDIRRVLREDPRGILEYILTPKGLNYGSMPKALIKFHAYQEGSRTPLEEHLVEAALYVRDNRRICRVHVTVSEEHRRDVEDHLADIRGRYEALYDAGFEIALSVQSPSTNTIAMDAEGRPFRDKSGRLVFRPGGHGSLLKNLNSIEDDAIFVKNIDNVVPDRLKPETVLYKKLLGGYLLKLQEEVFHRLRILEGNAPDEKQLSGIAAFCRERLSRTVPPAFDTFPAEQKTALLFDIMNRPLRVCGMVKNEGEPGGGPFWVEERDETRSLQIVEEAQIDMTSKGQREIWESSSWFNPVDLVCGIRDYRGGKFDLERYVDGRTWIVSHKSHEGQPLKVLERPGLWNGSMAGWNTVFVAVPSTTFNPVKTVEDLLRDEHRGETT